MYLTLVCTQALVQGSCSLEALWQLRGSVQEEQDAVSDRGTDGYQTDSLTL